MRSLLNAACLTAVVAVMAHLVGIVNPVTDAAAQGISQAESDHELNAALKQAANQMNGSLPMMVDKETASTRRSPSTRPFATTTR